MENKTAFGRQGEDLAVEFLLKEGYEILERNWYFRHNEVDILAKDHDPRRHRSKDTLGQFLRGTLYGR